MIQHPIRKTRSKTRKPKFISLRLEISSFENPQMTQKQQLNLFPLHPENHVEDRDENMEFIFNNDVNNTCCCLQSFLPNNNNNNDNNNNTISVSSEDDCGVGVGVDRCEEDADSLVRTAMRSRERSEGVEEKWVCYSEVVEKKGASESVEVSSSAAADEGLKKKQSRRQLSLKLDYQGILKAWSDKAPLYIKHEFPQTVPSLYDDHNLQSDSSFADRLMDGWGTDGNAWKVPEMGEKREDLEAKEGCKIAQREASVLRYKEKRQSRLFSKRIRYEVRKLNAEKRPRMKGRFVKRN